MVTRSPAASRCLHAALVAVAILAIHLAPLAPAHAEGKLAVRNWLHRPNVKLLAVEFYATWCTPCMEAVPRWKALHEKYRNQGFRLIVVNTLDPGGQCKSVGWNPDDYVCDLDGRIANAFGVGGGLPAAFLWSWQGNLLLRKGHIDAAESEVARYLAASPKVLISAYDANGKPDAALEAMVKAEVATAGKLLVVASEADRAKLVALRKSGHGLGKARAGQCRLGAEVSANALLEARLLGKGAGAKLAVTLNLAESGCLLASTYANYDPARPAASVREVIAALTDTLRQTPEMPAGLTRPKLHGEQASAPSRQAAPRGNKVIVNFNSTPPGAVVMVDGKLSCQATPCSRAVRSGRHAVSMQKEGFAGRETVLVLGKGSQVDWPLPKNEAWLSVVTAKPGLAVQIDGKPAGKTPIAERRVAPGRHEIEVSDRCYLPARQAVDLQPGQRQRVVVKAKERVAGVEVDVQDAGGNDVAATVFVDGEKVGESPNTFTLPLCSQRIEALKGGRRASRALKLAELGTSEMKLVLGKVEDLTKGLTGTSPDEAASASRSTLGGLALIAGVLITAITVMDYSQSDDEDGFGTGRTLLVGGGLGLVIWGGVQVKDSRSAQATNGVGSPALSVVGPSLRLAWSF